MSTSSEDRVAVAVEGPSNVVVNIAPSSSNVRAILVDITRPRKGRNYRKIRTPELDTDSDSSRDSDDVSGDEAVASSSRITDNAETIDDEHLSDHFDFDHPSVVEDSLLASTITDSDGSE